MENYDFRVQNHVLIKPYLISHERYIYVFYSVINLRSIYKISQKGICCAPLNCNEIFCAPNEVSLILSEISRIAGSTGVAIKLCQDEVRVVYATAPSAVLGAFFTNVEATI